MSTKSFFFFFFFNTEIFSHTPPPTLLLLSQFFPGLLFSASRGEPAGLARTAESLKNVIKAASRRVCVGVLLLQRHYRSLITAGFLSRPLCSRHRRRDLWCRFKWWEEQQRDKTEHFYLLYKYSSCALTGGIHYPPPACRIIPVGLLGSCRLLTVDLLHRSTLCSHLYLALRAHACACAHL